MGEMLGSLQLVNKAVLGGGGGEEGKVEEVEEEGEVEEVEEEVKVKEEVEEEVEEVVEEGKIRG